MQGGTTMEILSPGALACATLACLITVPSTGEAASSLITTRANIPAAQDFRLTNYGYWENAAKVIPPRTNTSCWDGRVIVSLGQNGAGGPQDPVGGAVLVRPLAQSNYATLNTAAWADGGLPFSPLTSSTGVNVLSTTETISTTDNQVERLRDGSIVVGRITKTWATLPNTSSGSQPSWANWLVYTKDAAIGSRLGTRNEVMFARSTDCGRTWQRFGALDSGAFDGVYGWPQKPTTCTGAETSPPCSLLAPGTVVYGIGGWDKPFTYQDPFSDWFFASANVKKGQNGTAGVGGAIFGTTGGASGGLTNWKVLKEVPAGAPLVMTTTPNRRVFAFSCNGSQPTLWYSLNPSDPTSFVATGINLNGVAPTAAPPCGFDGNMDVGRQQTWAISRASTDTNSSGVRIVYPTLNAYGTQSLAVVTAWVNDSNPAATPSVYGHGVIDSSNPFVMSAEFPTFVEPDFIDTPDGLSTNTAMLYWLDSTSTSGVDPATGEAVLDLWPSGCTRFRLFGNQFGGAGVGPGPFAMSSGDVNGCWSVGSNFGIGDYTTGGFFWDKHRLNFLGQWLEPNGIHANIVSVSPTHKVVHQPGLPGDVNGDALADLAVVRATSSGTPVAPLALSNGNGTFQLPPPQSVRLDCGQTVTGDFNGDGRTDALSLCSDGHIWVSTSQGDGTFTQAYSPTVFGPFSGMSGATLLAGDFNGDGYTDFLATGASGWTTVPMAYSNGDGSFTVTNKSNSFVAAVMYQAGTKIVVGDFNGDGLDDLAASGGSGWNTIPVAFSIAGNLGVFSTTNLSSTYQSFSGQSSTRLLSGDFDGDGRSDLLVLGEWPNASNGFPIAYSNGDGTFQVVNTTNNSSDNLFATIAGQPNAHIVIGDFDGNGLDDVAGTGGYEYLYGPAWTTIPIAFNTSNGARNGSFWVSNQSSTFQTWSQQSSAQVESSWK